MFNIKKNLLSKNEIRGKYRDYQIETEIKEVITKLVEDFEIDVSTQLGMNALRLDEQLTEWMSKKTLKIILMK
ncbi:hypothetical protein [Virgibacillus proomii]|uniref:hypothetical protein n=1 Tax=Virgibacillus proomii TaxID=84407 RepID=UPI00098500F8|nr:hypothetical protein [Virgibacillus proomii]